MSLTEKNAAVLAFSGICAKSFDFAFRAFYSTKLGAEGVGLLSLGFGLHRVMLTVATAGLGVAISKIVSEYMEVEAYGAVRQSMKIAISGVTCLSLIIIFIIFIGAEPTAKYVLKDVRIATGLSCLAPSVLFMGISYCLKGYFYAARKAWIPAGSEFLEQLVKFAAISFFLKIRTEGNIAYGCAAVFAGISIGELSSCLYLTLFYLHEAAKFQKSGTADGIPSAIIKISFPSTISSFAGSALRMQEEVWTISAFEAFGMSHGKAVSAYGIIYGMAVPMLVFPLTLAGSVTTLLVPEIARRNTFSDKTRLMHLVKRVYRFGVSAGMIVFAVFELFAVPLSELLYHTREVAVWVRILAWLCPIMFVDTLSSAMLNGLGKQFSLLFFGISDSLIRLLLIFVFVPFFGASALAGVIIISNLYTCFMSAGRVLGCNRAYSHNLN